MTIDQVLGILRAVLPAVLAYAVGRSWIPSESVGDITALIVTAIAAGWSVYSNRNAAIVSTAAAIPDVTVQVGQRAPPAIKALADDPAVVNVVPKK